MIEFHGIWIEQCEAAEGIRERHGVNVAVRYLVGAKAVEDGGCGGQGRVGKG